MIILHRVKTKGPGVSNTTALLSIFNTTVTERAPFQTAMSTFTWENVPH